MPLPLPLVSYRHRAHCRLEFRMTGKHDAYDVRVQLLHSFE